MTFLSIIAIATLGYGWGSEWGHLGSLIGGATGVATATLMAIAGELRLIRRSLAKSESQRSDGEA